MLLRLDQSVQELSAISSQSCQASDCHCRKMLHRLDQICELQWQSEERQIWLPMAGGSCTGWSNLRSIVPIYEVYRYLQAKFYYNFFLFYFSFYRLGTHFIPKKQKVKAKKDIFWISFIYLETVKGPKSCPLMFKQQ